MDGYVDECAVIPHDAKGEVEAVPHETRNDSCMGHHGGTHGRWGTDLENAENKAVRRIRFCDFASAGDDWDPAGRYRVWIPKTHNQMSEPYRPY